MNRQTDSLDVFVSCRNVSTTFTVLLATSTNQNSAVWQCSTLNMHSNRECRCVFCVRRSLYTLPGGSCEANRNKKNDYISLARGRHAQSFPRHSPVERADFAVQTVLHVAPFLSLASTSGNILAAPLMNEVSNKRRMHVQPYQRMLIVCTFGLCSRKLYSRLPHTDKPFGACTPSFVHGIFDGMFHGMS